jgi:hypothetical protein
MNRRSIAASLIVAAFAGAAAVVVPTATARADDPPTADAAEFWAQHATPQVWTLGQASYQSQALPSATYNAAPYQLTGTAQPPQPRDDAAQFWSKYAGQRLTIGNAVLIVPAMR